jgi:hypothetical protein
MKSRFSAVLAKAETRWIVGILDRRSRCIKTQILKKVDIASLASAMRVSKKWLKMIDSERVVWKQRLIDDGLWTGLGVEKEDEARRACGARRGERHRLILCRRPSLGQMPLLSSLPF